MSGILIIADHFDGLLRDTTRELLSAAVSLRDGVHGPITMAVLTDSSTSLVDQADLQGVDQLHHCNVNTQHLDPASYEEVICRLGTALRPRIIMLAHSANGMACAPAVAARLGSGFASDVFGIRFDGNELVVTRGAYANKLNMELGFPNKGIVVVTIRGATFKPVTESATAVRSTECFDTLP